jgi:heat shock protein 4
LIYNSKEKLGSIFKDFVEASKVPEILQKLDAANDWLYSEGQHSTRGMYTQKLDELKPLINPIAKRYQSHQ